MHMGPSFKAFLKGLSVFLEARTRSFASQFRHALSSALRPCRHEELGPVVLIHLRTEMNSAKSNPKKAHNQNPIQGWLHPLCLSLGPSGCEERIPQPNGASLNLNKVAGAENIYACAKEGASSSTQSQSKRRRIEPIVFREGRGGEPVCGLQQALATSAPQVCGKKHEGGIVNDKLVFS